MLDGRECRSGGAPKPGGESEGREGREGRERRSVASLTRVKGEEEAGTRQRRK